MEPQNSILRNPTVVAAVIGAIATVFAAIFPYLKGELNFSPSTNSLEESDTSLYWMNYRLSETELSQKSKRELDLIRNEIFARHGYIFQTSEYRDYFNGQPWYSPRYTCREFEDKSPLTDVQAYNVALIRRHQQAMGHFDDYDEIPCE
ncbi:MAG: YARHG domain-containing protein [Phormidium sp.]